MSKPCRVIVTGGAGFVGCHLVARLLEQGCHVIVIDNFSTGRRENLKDLKNIENLEIIDQDVITPVDIECDKIFHLACPASPPAYMIDPVHTLLTCVNGTLNMLQLAEKYHAHMLYTPTSEVYGDPEKHPQPEEYRGNVNCRGIRSCYDEGKRAAETLCFEYSRKGVWIRTARLFNTYGPNMDPRDGRVVSNFVMQALQGRDLTVYGDGSRTRSFAYVADTVEGLLRLMESEYTGPVNIGNPGEFTIGDFAKVVIEKIGSSSGIKYLPEASDDPHIR